MAFRFFKRLWSKPVPQEPVRSQADPGPRSPEQMIAGCEYELRQVRRDLQRTKVKPVAGLFKPKPEPFVLGARLRSGATRSAVTKPHAAIALKEPLPY